MLFAVVSGERVRREAGLQGRMHDGGSVAGGGGRHVGGLGD